MKKILIATTALVLVAGAASADVTVAGSGYFGLKYDSGNKAAGMNNTYLFDRTQLDIGGSKTTDSGLTFHGKFRVRSNSYTTANNINGGQVGITAGGWDVSVGNIADAIDAMSLYYNSEIGLSGQGGETIYGWPFNGYDSYGLGNNGVLATYPVGNLIVRGSVQTGTVNTTGTKNENAVSVFDKFGALSLEAGYVEKQNSFHAVTAVAEYALGTANVGLAYGSVKYTATGVTNATTTLYGNTTFGATTVSAFVSNTTNVAQKSTYGVGASYDLGSGAAIKGAIRKDNGLNSTGTDDTVADLGVAFKF
ncbi:porin [mine drainage metagenome]|uniref:Porin n=1 Tax=mine drainage metagenome TaxID=410659 RepID=A0A1J5Q931_9ZZZZ